MEFTSKKIILKLILFAVFEISHAHTVIGVIQGKREIVIKSKSQGQLKEEFVDVGSIVKEGETISILDNRKERIEFDIAESDYRYAKKEYEKSKQLSKYISKDELLKKENDFRKKKNILALRKYNLESKEIKTPIKGILVKSFIKEGEFVSSGAKTYEVIQFDNLVIDLHVPSKYLHKIALGDMLTFVHELDREKVYQGEISFIGPVLDKASGTVNIKITLNNPVDDLGNFLLKPGAMVKVSLD